MLLCEQGPQIMRMQRMNTDSLVWTATSVPRPRRTAGSKSARIRLIRDIRGPYGDEPMHPRSPGLFSEQKTNNPSRQFGKWVSELDIRVRGRPPETSERSQST